jgi:hypothetical protein
MLSSTSGRLWLASSGHRAEQHHAGVVDERVKTARLGDRALHGGGRLRLVGDVGLTRRPLR